MEELRNYYWELFDVYAQIDVTEQALGVRTPGANSEMLWQSNLCSSPCANPTLPQNPLVDVSDDEIYTLLL